MADLNYTPLLLPEEQEKAGEIIRDDLGRFSKGVSGNPNGRPKKKTLTEYIEDELGLILPSGINGKQNLARLILKLIFESKDTNMMKELWHYLDGMPKQKAELTGENGEPFIIQVHQSLKMHEETNE